MLPSLGLRLQFLANRLDKRTIQSAVPYNHHPKVFVLSKQNSKKNLMPKSLLLFWVLDQLEVFNEPKD